MTYRQNIRLINLVISAGFSALFSTVIVAVDTDIYRVASNINPNLMFLIDTSGSMGATVLTTNYDSSIDYSGACADNAVYYSTSQNPRKFPDCETSNKFLKSGLTCQEAFNSLDGESGFYIDDVFAWNDTDDAWKDPTRGGTLSYFECADDYGFHGLADGNSAVFPVNGVNGPFSSSAVDPSNILSAAAELVLFSANYLNWFNATPTHSKSTRIDTVKSVTTKLITKLGQSGGINVGLMRLNHEHGGRILYPATDIGNSGVATALNSAVSALSVDGSTPVTEALYEAMRYFRGEEVVYGTSVNGGESVGSSLLDADTYESPILDVCQESNILLLTDGDPTADDEADTAINLLSSAIGLPECSHGASYSSVGTTSCLDDLATVMYRTDNNTALTGNQSINTYTVGFNIDSPLLNAAGNANTGGQYFTVSDEASLQSAFQDVIEDILLRNGTFVSPTVTANSFDRVSHDNNLYYSLFVPNKRARWQGNVKRYQLGLVTDIDGNTVDTDSDGEPDIQIVDKNGNPAVDDEGEFLDNTVSFWTHRSIGNDGGLSEIGGLASRVPAYSNNDFDVSARNVYTYTQKAVDAPITNLTNSVNELHESNLLLTQDLLGVSGLANNSLVNLLKWSRGLDAKDEDNDLSVIDGRTSMGAPLHSEPLLVTYQQYTENGETKQRDMIYITTNDGYLHAFDTKVTDNNSSMEQWAFVPPELLPNLKALYDNPETNDLTYGLDGTADVWVNDVNNNGFLLGNDNSVETDEHAYLYFNQRRGGRNIYGLDVSNPVSPNYLFSVNGNDSRSNKLFSMGQTWSRPKFNRIKVYNNDTTPARLVTKEVIIFAGGYDTDHDAKSTRTADDKGNAIYIADAVTGKILWWTRGPSAGPEPDLYMADMVYSIPSDVRVIDINGDGITDRLYAIDLGGQLWRFDINNVLVDLIGERIIGGVIADLQLDSDGDTSTALNNRRFYYPPDAARIESSTGSTYISISIGSGLRPSPNSSAIQDRLYVIKDYFVNTPPTTLNETATTADDPIGYTKLYGGDLKDVSVYDSATQTAGDGSLENGWYINLPNTGEKSLAPALTASGIVFFTTYTPASIVNNNLECSTPGVGDSRVYALDVETGGPVAKLSDSPAGAVLGDSDRSLVLDRKGIAGNVTVIFPDLPGVSPKPLIGTEIIPVKIDNKAVQTYWYQDHGN